MKTVPFSQVRYFVSGGDAMPDKIATYFALLYRRKICNGYGLTETAPFIAGDMEDELAAPNTVGHVAYGISYKLCTEAGENVAPGEVGILWVKGDNVMLGYYNAPEATQTVLQDGWLNTGDFAYVDEKGKLVITGRHKDLIISKGFNIYPQEIENVILMHPNVLKVGVVGKIDADAGEIPIAFVQLIKVQDAIEKELLLLCKEQLSAYKIPKQFIIIKDMPVTSLQKVDKKVLRKMMSDERMK